MTTSTKFSGSRIRQARHDAGMTQAALATAAGTRERNIIRWENDQHDPRLEHVMAIARATGKDLSFFLAELTDDDEEPQPGGDSRQMLAALHRALGQVLANWKEQ